MGKVGILCEFSGVVRDAFIRRGHNAISCDLLPTEAPGPHIQGDCLAQDWSGFDLLICHPPCTHLANCGAKHFPAKRADGRQKQAVDFFMALAGLDCPRIAIENPVGIMSTLYRSPDQVVQPWHFGDSVNKPTCLWLKNLPTLAKDAPLFAESKIVDRGEFVTFPSGRRMHKFFVETSHKPMSVRGHLRSVSFAGITEAMADQWGSLL